MRKPIWKETEDGLVMNEETIAEIEAMKQDDSGTGWHDNPAEEEHE